MTSVLIADDHGIVREGLRRVIEAEPDLQVCGEATDGCEVLELVQKRRPDVLVLDISMPRLGGLETLEKLRTRRQGLKIVLLSVHGDPPFVQSAISLGTDGYVLKNSRAGEIVAAIRAVVRGGSYFSPPVAREIVEQLQGPGAHPPPSERLSVRERQVLGLIADGLSAKEIGVRLEVSTKTVDAHRRNLMRKLGVRKNTQLVRYAFRHGLLEP